MKDTNLYFILILIAIIIFACVGNSCNKKTLEGFEQSSNVQNSFDKGCIKACEKEAQANNTPNYENKCKKNCDKITEQCKFYTFNSPEWWLCLKNINPNITIPQHIKDEAKQNANTSWKEIKNDWEKELNNFDNSHYDNNMDQIIDQYSQGQNNKELRHNYKKLLKEAENQNRKLRNELQQRSGNNSSANNTQGIPSSQIPVGDEDLYILKSQIVPPVCPECPPVNCGDCKTKCQPCPPPARCPEPAFECKKVPNYAAAKTNPYLPVPWLNSFSQFNNSYVA
tara:strand:+ start:261 stop:1106 length:846 start_codon:yes stop_codon:yes gene_type:complete